MSGEAQALESRGRRAYTKLTKQYPPVGVVVVTLTNAGAVIRAVWNGEFWKAKDAGGGTITHWRATGATARFGDAA